MSGTIHHQTLQHWQHQSSVDVKMHQDFLTGLGEAENQRKFGVLLALWTRANISF